MSKKRARKLLDQDTGEELSAEPLSVFTILLSVSALLIANARWIEGHMDTLAEYGGYAAATDLANAGEFVIAAAGEQMEEMLKWTVNIPTGFAYEALKIKQSSDEEKDDLPF